MDVAKYELDSVKGLNPLDFIWRKDAYHQKTIDENMQFNWTNLSSVDIFLLKYIEIHQCSSSDLVIISFSPKNAYQ